MFWLEDLNEMEENWNEEEFLFQTSWLSKELPLILRNIFSSHKSYALFFRLTSEFKFMAAKKLFIINYFYVFILRNECILYAKFYSFT